FEYEIAGRDSELFRREDLLLKRDGAVITARDRRFLDLRLPAGKAYLREKLVRFLKENGFSYLKTDYNESFGVGCDSPHGEAPGEGGRQVCEESVAWADELRREIPDLVIENCASGGSRVEPLRMSKVSMCSFSDAHECDEIPFVAANVSRVVSARQMQVWTVLREGDSPARTVYSLAAAMLGRICLSGDVVNMTEEKRTLLRAGLDFYGEVKEIVKRGNIVGIDCNVQSYRAPRGRQIYTKEYEERRLVIVHALGDSQEIVVPLNGYRLKRAFTVSGYSVCDGALYLWAAKEGGGASEEEGNFRAGAFLLEKVSADY
ncbi:MAG: glycoside hydrolase family 36 protein, partial [Candidatus Gallimonas sp.]